MNNSIAVYNNMAAVDGVTQLDEEREDGLPTRVLVELLAVHTKELLRRVLHLLGQQPLGQWLLLRGLPLEGLALELWLGGEPGGEETEVALWFLLQRLHGASCVLLEFA